MEGKRFIHGLALKNFLSYGSEGENIVENILLQPLNVLIGPNSSGKSNLIEAICLLKAATNDLAQTIRNGGGVSEYLWKGTEAIPIASIRLDFFDEDNNLSMYYEIAFTKIGQGFEIIKEGIALGRSSDQQGFRYYYAGGKAELFPDNRPQKQIIDRKKINLEQSILSQIRDPFNYTFISNTASAFSSFKIYRELRFDVTQPPRQPAQVSLPGDFLWENAYNLALVLNNLENEPRFHRQLTDNFKLLYPEAKKIITLNQGSTLQIYVEEEGLERTVSATRLSDGTLRYLCLLAILCHPSPPPLICIEEPEIGLHPDILPTIAKLLVEASQRTQLIVTTHSDILVSAIAQVSDSPEPVLVCERDKDGTHLHRLEKEKLKAWLEDYSLGDLWIRGELGGKRW